MSLRRRLFFYVFVPVAVLYLAFGLFGVYQTRAQLIDDVDDELRSTSAVVAALSMPLDSTVVDELFGISPDVGSTQLLAIVDTRTNEVIVSPSSRDGQQQNPPPNDAFSPTELARSLNTPFDMTSADGDLNYRAIASRLDGGSIVVVAEPLDRIEGLTRRFVAGTIINGAILLAAMASVVWFAVRHGLRPLGAFVASTTRVAEGDLSERVDASEHDPAFAAIASATNSMLDQVEISYEQQRIGRERLNELVADAAHELRTPLTALRGTIDMQKMGAIDSADKTRAAFRGLDEHTQRMQHIVDELLVIARAENIRVAVQSRATSIVDIDTLVQREAAAARRKAPGRVISVDVARAGLEVAGDEALLGIALKHVLDNALVHTPPGSAVRVEVRGSDVGVEVRVADDGPGIPDQIKHTVFERFVRADGSRSRATGGAGLGLSIVKSVIESVGGTVSYENGAESGCTFLVELPRYVRTGKSASEVSLDGRDVGP